MKIALATDDNMGLDAVVSHHFGRCPYYIVVDVDDKEIKDVKAVKNPFYESHGQTGEVPNFIHSLGVDVIISGGMGPKAIGFSTTRDTSIYRSLRHSGGRNKKSHEWPDRWSGSM